MIALNRTALATAVAAVALSTAALAAGTAAAASAPTWTITKGGAISASAKNIAVTDRTAGLSGSCTGSKLKATLKSGKLLSGKKAGAVTSVSVTGCGLAGYKATVTAGHLPWHLNLVSYAKKTGVTSATLTGIHLTIKVSAFGATCSAIVDGTGPSAYNGGLKATYSNATGKLTTLASGGNLHLYKVTNCFNIVNNGDAVTLVASYAVTPKQKITSP